jgi:hypothetical protein
VYGAGYEMKETGVWGWLSFELPFTQPGDALHPHRNPRVACPLRISMTTTSVAADGRRAGDPASGQLPPPPAQIETD